jgi:ferredoxin
MAKVLIATFSQNGSTGKISDKITEGLRASGWEVDHFTIGSKNPPDLKDYNAIGIGTPVYFFRPPFLVKDFIKSLKNIDHLSSFVFVLHGTNPGNCGNWIRKKLRAKGTRDLGYFLSFGADYWMGYIKRGYMFAPDNPGENDLSDALDFSKKIVQRFSEVIPKVEPFDPSTPLIYSIERAVVNRTYVNHFYSKVFRADKNCNNCGICIKGCPTQNITQIDEGKLKWDSSCLLCMKCEMNCPKDAVHSAVDLFIFSPFMVYNIYNARRKSIPYVKVEHTEGKTTRI